MDDFPLLRLQRALSEAAAWVQSLAGWSKFGLAYAAGLLSAAAFAPYGMFPLLLAGYALLIILIDGAAGRPRPRRSAFFAGWSFGFGQFMGGLYWIVYPFLVDPLEHAWQIPFAVTLLPAGLALFPGAAAAASASVWRPGTGRVFVFTAFFAIAEYLRGHVLTGFPWNLPAYSWGASLAVLQSASMIGAYGLSLLTVLLGASLALLCDPGGRAGRLPAAMFAVFILLWGAGWARLAELPPQLLADVRLRLVQPDVPQDEKYLREFQLRNWERLISLSLAKTGKPPTILVWPEAAPPFLLQRAPAALDDIALLTAGKRVLVTGAVRAERGGEGRAHFFNSVFIFARGGAVIATYDKFHLVPFGEYMPFSRFFHALGIDKLVQQPGSFASGDGPESFALPGAPPVGPLICYEVIFPGAVVAANRPSWLANVTDDSWFGPAGSSGPPQHLLSAQVRAIEEGLPIARAANTGISAIIDPEGRILERLGAGKMGTVDGDLPAALSPTIYARFGDALFLLLLIACALMANIEDTTVRVLIAKRYFSQP